jgi:uncharacterized protein involved in type VI secretion and phage assembly
MTLFESMTNSANQEARAGRIAGVVVGIVTNNQDPDGMGRVKVKFPWLSSVDESAWARMAVPMAGDQRGVYFLPEIDDEVLIAFEHGDVNFPCVLGALWNGRDVPPEKNDDGKNNVRVIKSRSGHVIKLNDEDGKETIEIVDKSNNNSIVFNTSQNTITVTTDKDIVLSASNGKITLHAQNVEITSSDATKIEAGGTMDLNSTRTMTIKGEAVNIN